MVHEGELPPAVGPVLRVDGRIVYMPTDARLLTDAGHRRTTAMIFGDLSHSALDSSRTLELVMPH